MLVCKKHKVVFVDVPKTASRSIYNVLLTHYNADKLRVHAIKIPDKYSDFFSFCVVRNPYDRACSLYWSMCHRQGDQQGYLADFARRNIKNTLANYLMLLGAQKQKHQFPQYRFYEGNNITQVLRFETLQEDWDTLPFLTEQITLPHSNGTAVNKTAKTPIARPDWRDMVDKKSGNLINQIFKKDFELFGYTMETFI